MRRSALFLGFLAGPLLVAGAARATEFYVDPAAGATGDGSQGAPWQTLEKVVTDGHVGKEIKAGDTVWLRSGYHGTFTARSGTYAPPITLAAAAGQTPQLAKVSFNGTQGWIVRGLSISPSYAPSPTTGGDMVLMDGSSSDIVFENSELFSVKDTSAWTDAEWKTETSNGVFVRGDRITVRNNSLTNVRFGISVDGPNALIDHNQIVNFSADGLRGLGDNGVFQYNLVKNVYAEQYPDGGGDGNHDDGFQSWSTGPGGPGSGVVTGVVLRGNVIINREDPNQKYPNDMQGIGCFDGFFDGWVVENNVVITNHWHGISFYGMRNSRIVNNTVIDVDSASPGPPWILVTPHKDGRPSENVVVRNNLATDYDLAATGLVDDHNTTLKMTELAAFFVDPAKFDLHLLKTAAAVDTGSADQAPALDADMIPRPQGAGVDLGAYEWHEPAVVPAEGGLGAGGAPGAGGSAGSGGGAPGSGGARVVPDSGPDASASAPDAGDVGGCGCRAARRTSGQACAALGLALLAFMRRRSRC